MKLLQSSVKHFSFQLLIFTLITLSNSPLAAEIIANIPEGPLPLQPIESLPNPILPENTPPSEPTKLDCPSGMEPECSVPTLTQNSSSAECECRESNKCKYYVLSYGMVGLDPSERAKYHGKSMVQWTGAKGGLAEFNPSELSCLQKIANDCNNPNFLLSADSERDYSSNTDIMKNKDGCIHFLLYQRHDITGTLLGTGPTAFDSNCNAVKNSKIGDDLCGNLKLTVLATPISLLWSNDAEIDKDISIVNFPINGKQNEKWFTWKASHKTPLLVYDPAHSEKIENASQLFGNWTFAKTELASLQADSGLSQIMPEPHWENGYQALATLDLNQDGQVAGPELEPLALWFDENQDAISQPGEVKRLNDLKVISLYYTPDRTDPKTGNIYATKGYQRLLDGKLVVGTSVDWLSESFNSKLEALSTMQIRRALEQ